MDSPRLIEVAFPLKQASLDSVHEKNVRHGHISTLHIWPARRPLAACRAALIATLLPDPGNDAERKKLLEKLGGTVVKVSKKKKLPSGKVEDKIVEETVGGILHWGRESGPDLEFFRQKIREAYGGRAPKVLDPFAGGGAIPLEAMRLGCEATAVDINPVAWFILKCTLEYPQKLAGQHRPLPDFALQSREFMEGFFKNTGKLTKKQMERNLQAVQDSLFPPPDVDLAWHVRAWGWWVLQQARKELEKFYPTIDGKPTVAYLWARTVACKNCRATIPLLKTRWLCKKDRKRVLLTMEPKPDKSGVIFGVQNDVPIVGGNAAQRREHDKKAGAGTMSRSGAQCPCCGAFMTMEDMQQEGMAERLAAVTTAVVVDGSRGKEYRLSVPEEARAVSMAKRELDLVSKTLPFGLPNERIVEDAKHNTWCVQYGLGTFSQLFTPRQLVALTAFVRLIRSIPSAMREHGYENEWIEAVVLNICATLDKLLDHSALPCSWNVPNEQVRQVFARFALPMAWDYVEVSTIAERCGAFSSMLDSTHAGLESLHRLVDAGLKSPTIERGSVLSYQTADLDCIVTDPPYYDAIGYSVLMDFFYVWLRRTLEAHSPEVDAAFSEPLAPKWDHTRNDGELIDDSSRFGGDKRASKKAYEEGMYQAFVACHKALRAEGRMVVVFANKQPDAWEALVSAIIRAGFTVDGSWPIQTERQARTRSLSSAALASSVWLVCKKRPDSARVGWDTKVLADMQDKIHDKLREFWDAGIRGPDFVWAATGPALEAYSQHPVVKKANEPDQVLSVGEFLRAVRRLVVDFVVGRVLTRDGEEAATGLDDITTYYLLHRNDFGMADAPIGPCILYALSCGLADTALADAYDILARTGGKTAEEEEENETAGGEAEEGEIEEGTGSKVRLKAWNQRKRPGMGYDPAVDSPRARRAKTEPPLFPDAAPELPKAREIPLIDMIHRLMHLWKAGDVVKVDEYLDLRGLRRNELFKQLLQALIELSQPLSEERSLLESLSNHLQARGQKVERGELPYTDAASDTPEGE